MDFIDISKIGVVFFEVFDDEAIDIGGGDGGFFVE